MKINFDLMKDIFPTERANNTKTDADAVKKTGFAEAAVVLGQDHSASVPGGMTYEKSEMGFTELQEQLDLTDTELTQMYMTVLSNTVSGEKLGELAENGYDLSELSAEDMVSILDHIKVALLEGGTRIDGYTDTVSEEGLEEILGNAGYARALKTGISDLAMQYMLQNQLLPTPENLFKATYSVGADRPKQNGSEEKASYDYLENETMRRQIVQILTQAGLKESQETIQDAQYLLEKDLPLTVENLELLQCLKPFREPQDLQIMMDRIGMQMERAVEPKQADLSKDLSLLEEALQIKLDAEGIRDEVLRQAVFEGDTLSIKNLARRQRTLEIEPVKDGIPESGSVIWDTHETESASKGTFEIESVSEKNLETEEDTESTNESGTEHTAQDTTDTLKYLKARRQLEQIRLEMTVGANIRLLRSGYSIDTMPLESLLKELDEQVKQLERIGVEKTGQVVETTENLKALPLQSLGFVVNKEIPFTVLHISEKGRELAAEYEKAGQAYETMQTQVRGDLGDSVQKAFRNISALLSEMGMEDTEENRRAVRALGYNRIELTPARVEEVKQADKQLQELFENMNPGKVLRMIREGVDPLTMEIPQLNRYLEQMGQGFIETADQYASFLQKMDRDGSISKEERSSFIGLYRLAKQVVKSDGAALGFLLGEGERITFNNLLHAVRSGKKKALDYTIDDQFAGIESKKQGEDILEQIQSSFQNTQAVNALLEYHQPVNLSNLMAVTRVMEDASAIYNEIHEKEKTLGKRWDSEFKELPEDLREALSDNEIHFTSEEELPSLEELAGELVESMENEETLLEGFALFSERLQQMLEQLSYSSEIQPVDIRALQGLCKQVRLSSNLAKESFFQIPIATQDGFMVMNLHVRKGKQDADGKAEISMNLSQDKAIAATIFINHQGEDSLQIKDNSLTAHESEDAIVEKWKENLARYDAAYNADEKRADGQLQNETGRISAERLYILSKIFMETVRNSL